jgi:threonine/homoserine/homoserine lactone efflux protein
MSLLILIKYFIIGSVTALPFTISFGPVFIAITETSLKRGFSAGATVALGILLSDAVFVTLIGLGFAAFINDEFSKSIFSLFGGIMLMLFGISFIMKKIELHQSTDLPIGKKPMESFLKGVIINSLNPYVALFWTGAVGLVSTELSLSGISFGSYFGGFLLTLFISDLVKARLAESFRKNLSTRLNIIYPIIGLLFAGFGLKLLWESGQYFLN